MTGVHVIWRGGGLGKNAEIKIDTIMPCKIQLVTQESMGLPPPFLAQGSKLHELPLPIQFIPFHTLDFSSRNQSPFKGI